MRAGQVVMVSDDDATVARPFVFQNGVLYLDQVKVNSLSALSANLGNVDISNAYIGSLVVGTSNIAQGAVSRQASFSSDAGVPGRFDDQLGWHYGVMSVTLEHGAGSPPVLAFASCTGGYNDGVVAVRWVDVNSGATYPASGALDSDQPWSGIFIFQPPAGRTSSTYRIDVRPYSSSKGAQGGVYNCRMVALALLK